MLPRPLTRAAVIAATLAFASTATAAGQRPPVSTSRMGAVKGPGVVAAGVLQLEAGYLHADRGPRVRRLFGETLLRVGLGRETELRATLPSYLRVETPHAVTEGATDAALVLKHRLRQAAGWMPAVAVTLGSSLPTGADEIGAGEAQPEGGVSAEWKLPRRLALVGIAAHRSAIVQGDRSGQTMAGAAVRADLTRAVAAQLEYAGVSYTRAGAADLAQLRATAALRLTRDLQLDAWAARATQDGFPAETQCGFGFTRRW
ncbi:MAG TPA: hypothetical protein VFQ45_09190 [Longimicrobium sp.]|nr:hypothetical protein [Longimicrobium sp.]